MLAESQWTEVYGDYVAIQIAEQVREIAEGVLHSNAPDVLAAITASVLVDRIGYPWLAATRPRIAADLPTGLLLAQGQELTESSFCTLMANVLDDFDVKCETYDNLLLVPRGDGVEVAFSLSLADGAVSWSFGASPDQADPGTPSGDGSPELPSARTTYCSVAPLYGGARRRSQPFP